MFKKVGIHFTRVQWLSVVMVAAVNIFASCSVSVQAPFYPAEAQRKGASATEHGLVFGSYELTNFIVSPLFGKIVEKRGLRSLLAEGMGFSALSIILFGFLDYVNDRTLFIGFSILLRVLESVGSSAAVIAGFSLIGSVFPDSVSTVFATTEIFYGAGFVIAPTIGGFLYNFGGFPLPFFVVGGMGAIIALSILIFVPSTTELPVRKENYNIMSALKVPAIALDAMCVVMVALTVGFYSALLEPHLRQFHLSTQVTSLFFIIAGGTYAFVSPFIGRLLDTRIDPKTMIAIGCVLHLCSFSLIGPLPFLPFDATVANCIVALLIQGFAQAAGTVSTFTDSFISARKAGFPDAVGTYGLISGIWTSAFALGGFIGPTIAGILYDLGGFRWATVFVFGSYIILLIVMLSFIGVTKHRNNGYEEIKTEEWSPISAKGNG